MIAGRIILATLLILSAVVPSPCRAENDKNKVPPDFKLVARYYPGYSDWQPWKTTITADGAVKHEHVNEDLQWDSTELKPLTSDAVAVLAAKVRESEFFKLEKSYDVRRTDNDTLVLIVTMDGKTKEVSVYAPDAQKDKEEVKRFLTLWNEVLRKVPSPNKDQRPRE